MVVLGNATRNDFCSSFIFSDCNCLFIRIKKSEHQICVFAVRGTRRSTEPADGGVIYTIKPSAWMAASKRLLTKDNWEDEAAGEIRRYYELFLLRIPYPAEGGSRVHWGTTVDLRVEGSCNLSYCYQKKKIDRTNIYEQNHYKKLLLL